MYKQFRYILIGILGFILNQQLVLGQDLRYLCVEGLEDQYTPNKVLVDSAEVVSISNKLTRELYNEGYWLANADDVKFKPDTVFVYFHQGRRFEKVIFDISDLDSLSHSFEPNYQSPIHTLSVVDKIEEILSQFENSGYPFAAVVIDSSLVREDDIFVKLSIDKGMLITFDTISIYPERVLKEQFLNKYLGANIGKRYDESIIESIPLRLENLSFIELNEIKNTFQLRKSKLFLDIKEQKVNYFDGILGFVPKDEDGEVEFTGELNLSVKNLFQSAKAIDIHWEKLTNNTQKLDASYLNPIFLGTPLDLFFNFNQLRQDTLFSNRAIQLGFQYYPLPRLKVSASYKNQLGNELNDTSGQSGNFMVDNYIISGTIWNLDKKTNPKQGFMFNTGLEIGRKESQDQSSEVINSTQYALNGELDLYKRIMSKSVIYFSINGAWLNNKMLYLNDLYRVGGLYSIRGFDEGAFYASKYIYTTIEWRFYTDNVSNFFVFYDQAYLNYTIVGGEFEDTPSGLGAGMEFMTNSGKFQLVYGLGKRDNQSFSFDSSKIHFGYTALF